MRRCQADTARDPGARATARDCAVRELLGIEVECKICKLWWVLSTPIKSLEVDEVLLNSPTPRAPSGSAAEPACESELPLISQELPQELPRTADSVATLSGDAQWFHGYTQWLHQCTGASTGDSIGASTLISQDLTQELPLISQELPPEIPQPLPQEASEAVAATPAATLARAAARSGEAHADLACAQLPQPLAVRDLPQGARAACYSTSTVVARHSRVRLAGRAIWCRREGALLCRRRCVAHAADRLGDVGVDW